MNFKTGDLVIVIAGKDKGKEGKITKILKKENKVIVEGVNIVKKHMKGNGQTPGSIQEVENPIHVSNVMIKDPKTGERSRIGHKVENDKKVRISKKSGEKLD